MEALGNGLQVGVNAYLHLTFLKKIVFTVKLKLDRDSKW